MHRLLSFACLALCLFAAPPVPAQQSAGFVIEQSVINQGGAPAAGVTPDSPEFAISQLSIGEALTPSRLTSATFTVDAGFGGAWLPPGEVKNLNFSDVETLFWDANPTAYSYRLHRATVADLPEFEIDTCVQPTIQALTATDAEIPLPGESFLYIVLAVSRIAEEGSAGVDSGGSIRTAYVCP